MVSEPVLFKLPEMPCTGTYAGIPGSTLGASARAVAPSQIAAAMNTARGTSLQKNLMSFLLEHLWLRKHGLESTTSRRVGQGRLGGRRPTRAMPKK